MEKKVIIPTESSFEVSFSSDVNLVTKILEFNSNHFLLNSYEDDPVMDFLEIEPSLEENGKLILRRYFNLRNVSLEPYHYFVFLVSSPKETFCDLCVNNESFSFSVSP
jgi:hypothetical protein